MKVFFFFCCFYFNFHSSGQLAQSSGKRCVAPPTSTQATEGEKPRLTPHFRSITVSQHRWRPSWGVASCRGGVLAARHVMTLSALLSVSNCSYLSKITFPSSPFLPSAASVSRHSRQEDASRFAQHGRRFAHHASLLQTLFPPLCRLALHRHFPANCCFLSFTLGPRLSV